MKFAITALVAFAGLATAQLNLPSCAMSCVTQFASGENIGACSSVNIACICGSANFLSDIACCLAGACNQADQEKATSEAITFCKVAGGVTGLPTAVSCATQSQTRTSTGTSSATGSVTSSGTSTVTSSTATTTTGSGTVAGQSGSRTSTSTTASATPNAGAKYVAGMGAGVLGAVAVALL